MTSRRSSMHRPESPPSAGFGQLCRMSNSAVHPLASATDYSRLAEPQPALAVAWTQHSRNCERLETVNKFEKKERGGGRERKKGCTYKPELAGSQWPAYSSGEPRRTCCSPAAANHWNGQRKERKRHSRVTARTFFFFGGGL